MKAIVVKEFGGPEVLELATIPEPAPGWEQVVVHLEAIGVNPVETYIRSGNFAVRPALPYTPGTDGAGVIMALGNGVARLRQGQRVYVAGSLSGAYAERTLCAAAHVHPLPENVSFAQGAALGVPYTTAHVGLFFRGRARAGETVLVHGGTGGVGLAAVQLARAAGLTVFATGGTDAGRQLAREQGAHEVFDHKASDYFDQILRATSGRGVGLILEMLANVNLGKDPALLAQGGRVVVIGSRGSVEIDPRDLMARNADVRGVMLFNTPPDELARTRAALHAGLENGSLRPVIGREFPLAEAAKAHEAVMSSGATGKIILKP
ncbi:MAG TPA: NADPH:quinone reductase [Chthoniobacteraceae bacterium]|nr:NADPH:quinone reductase [Chthoniobacteraceae bacterium]